MEIHASVVSLVVSVVTMFGTIVTIGKVILPLHNQITILISDLVGATNRPGAFERINEIENKNLYKEGILKGNVCDSCALRKICLEEGRT